MEVSGAVWGCQNGTQNRIPEWLRWQGQGGQSSLGSHYLLVGAFTVNRRWGMAQVTALMKTSGGVHIPGYEKPGLF